ncbi:unnamed protein product [Ceratitis capitata]|uniref:(Mediterranean fruit fly) hypothetical protein n=1 Tax=Ceratitis capitata TaxID=7213 RepID=A0A811UHJ2_CERCA|nr:unnamed protein product [Ceratitis capitata]
MHVCKVPAVKNQLEQDDRGEIDGSGKMYRLTTTSLECGSILKGKMGRGKSATVVKGCQSSYQETRS